MKPRFANQFLIPSVTILILAVSVGCAQVEKVKSLSGAPGTDRILLYDRPYDFTYLKTIEALGATRGWILEQTDKEKGLIVMRNTQYGNLFDKDKSVAYFRVKRVSRTQTSVELEPRSRHVVDGEQMLDNVDKVVMQSTELRRDQLAETST